MPKPSDLAALLEAASKPWPSHDEYCREENCATPADMGEEDRECVGCAARDGIWAKKQALAALAPALAEELIRLRERIGELEDALYDAGLPQ